MNWLMILIKNDYTHNATSTIELVIGQWYKLWIIGFGNNTGTNYQNKGSGTITGTITGTKIIKIKVLELKLKL